MGVCDVGSAAFQQLLVPLEGGALLSSRVMSRVCSIFSVKG